MYRILIADDEKSIREGLGHYLDKKCPDYHVAALAEDGLEALRLSKECLPDVIITDINMPRINGLEYLEQMKEILPDAILLVVTGYERFEYAVQCIRLGVREYFLKPVDTEKLCLILNQVKQELDREEASWEIEKASLDDARIRGVILEDRYPEAEALDQVFCPIIGRGYTQAAVPVADWLQARFQKSARVCLISDYPEAVFVLQMDREDPDRRFLQITQILTAVHNRLMKEEGNSLCFFMGKFVRGYSKLRKAYDAVKSCAYYGFLNHAAPVVSCEEILARKQDICSLPPSSMRLRVQVAVECGNMKDAKAGCEEITSWFLLQEGLGADIIRFYYLSSGIGAVSGLSDADGITNEVFERYQNQILACESVEQLSLVYLDFTSGFAEKKRESRNRGQCIVSQIDAIVEENIGEPDFSLSDVASRLFLSPNYLRALFKKETGVTFVEYLTGIRMERAKLLLKSGDKKIQDVAEQVGYLDSRYFSVTFKKHCQISPMEYQNQQKEENKCLRKDTD